MIAEPLAAARTSRTMSGVSPWKRRLDVSPQHGAELGKLALAPIGHVNIYPY